MSESVNEPQVSQDYDEEEESEEENNDYVKDDFINDDEEYSEEYSYRRKKSRKRKKRDPTEVKKEEEELDEDDLEIINAAKSKKKGRKRLQKAKDKAAPDEEDLDQIQKFEDEEADGGAYGHPQYPDEFIESSARPSGGQNIEVANEQLDYFNQIFHDSEDEEEDEEMQAPVAKKEDLEEHIRTPGALMEDMGLVTDEEWRTEVAKVDIPERLYVRLKGRLEPTEAELEEEAKWIYASKKHWKGNHVGEEKMVESIKNLLRNFRKNHFDIPFIATYRFYLYQQELQPTDCYKIYELDLEWSSFLKSKKAIEQKLDEIRPHIQDADMIDECLALATSNNELQDVHNFITFYRSTLPGFQMQRSKV